MRIASFTENQTISSSEWTPIYEFNQVGSVVQWFGFVFQLSHNSMLIRVTVNDEVRIDSDLEDWDSGALDLDSDAIPWVRQYREKRWAIQFPHPVFTDRFKVELKHKNLNSKALVKGFSITQDR